MRTKRAMATLGGVSILALASCFIFPSQTGEIFRGILYGTLIAISLLLVIIALVVINRARKKLPKAKEGAKKPEESAHKAPTPAKSAPKKKPGGDLLSATLLLITVMVLGYLYFSKDTPPPAAPASPQAMPEVQRGIVLISPGNCDYWHASIVADAQRVLYSTEPNDPLTVGSNCYITPQHGVYMQVVTKRGEIWFRGVQRQGQLNTYDGEWGYFDNERPVPAGKALISVNRDLATAHLWQDKSKIEINIILKK